MIIVAGFALVVALTAAFGGDLAAMASLRWRGIGFVACAIAVQVLLSLPWFTVPRALGETVNIASYAAAAVFFWLNRQVRGLLVVGLGAAANLLAIAANSGVMPTSQWAITTAGLVNDSDAFQNSRAFGESRLLFLGDVFAIPSGWPLANVFSIGDVILLVGAFVVMRAACGTRSSQPIAATVTGMPFSTDVPDSGSIAS